MECFYYDCHNHNKTKTKFIMDTMYDNLVNEYNAMRLLNENTDYIAAKKIVDMMIPCQYFNYRILDLGCGLWVVGCLHYCLIS